MSRKLRRLQEKKQKIDIKQMQKAYQRQAVKISQEVAAETEDFAKHHMTGQLLTAMALVLRKVYGWTDKEVIAMLDQVNGITNALNAGEIDDADLITECEKYGVKVSWEVADDRRLYIGAIDIYEHCASDSDLESRGD